MVDYQRGFMLVLIAVVAFVGVVNVLVLTEACAQEFTNKTVYYEDGTSIQYFANGTEIHRGPGLNPTGDTPFRPQNTTVFPNGSSTADGLFIESHECFADYSCITMWSNGQVDKSRNSEEGTFLTDY